MAGPFESSSQLIVPCFLRPQSFCWSPRTENGLTSGSGDKRRGKNGKKRKWSELKERQLILVWRHLLDSFPLFNSTKGETLRFSACGFLTPAKEKEAGKIKSWPELLRSLWPFAGCDFPVGGPHSPPQRGMTEFFSLLDEKRRNFGFLQTNRERRRPIYAFPSERSVSHVHKNVLVSRPVLFIDAERFSWECQSECVSVSHTFCFRKARF